MYRCGSLSSNFSKSFGIRRLYLRKQLFVLDTPPSKNLTKRNYYRDVYLTTWHHPLYTNYLRKNYQWWVYTMFYVNSYHNSRDVLRITATIQNTDSERASRSQNSGKKLGSRFLFGFVVRTSVTRHNIMKKPSSFHQEKRQAWKIFSWLMPPTPHPPFIHCAFFNNNHDEPIQQDPSKPC